MFLTTLTVAQQFALKFQSTVAQQCDYIGCGSQSIIHTASVAQKLTFKSIEGQVGWQELLITF